MKTSVSHPGATAPEPEAKETSVAKPDVPNVAVSEIGDSAPPRKGRKKRKKKKTNGLSSAEEKSSSSSDDRTSKGESTPGMLE